MFDVLESFLSKSLVFLMVRTNTDFWDLHYRSVADVLVYPEL